MLKHLIITLSYLLLFLPTFAAVIQCKPGQLSQIIGNQTDATSLTVNGAMDVTDFDFIAESMPKLTKLVINADIVEYKGEPTRSGSGYAQPRTLPAYALFGTPITDLTLAGSTSAIGEAALAGSRLTRLTLGNKITAVPDYLAKDVTTLRDVELAPSITSIGTGAFEGCTALTQVYAPGVATIGDAAFKGCTSLTDFEFSESVTSIGDYAFASTGLNTVDLTLASGLKSLGTGSFAECKALTVISFPESLTVLPESLLFGASELQELYLPTTLTEIGTSSLAGLSSINPRNAEEIFGDTEVSTIGDYGIANWSNTDIITLPSFLTYMGDHAMQNWTSMTGLNIPKELTDVPALGDDVWAGVNQKNVTLKIQTEPVANRFSEAPQWKDFTIAFVTSDAILGDDLLPNQFLSVTFEEHTMNMECHERMATVALYDIAGHTLTALTPRANTASIDITPWRSTPFVLMIQTESNKIISKKIIRK
ncbi:MAG: leucine-rich repeat domain-containing protein [Muribaculaceae bacterium]|nr:leucine-rich repeat domain-containing protein [Muribaculaceae bacterium]